EQALFPLFVSAAVAGYWSALRAGGIWLAGRFSLFELRARPRLAAIAVTVAGVAAVLIIPAVVVNFAVNRSGPYAAVWKGPPLNQPELMDFFASQAGRRLGEPFRGSLQIPPESDHAGYTIVALWGRGIPTVHEYSQLATPQAFYFLYSVLQN